MVKHITSTDSRRPAEGGAPSLDEGSVLVLETLAQATPAEEVQWRKDGRPTQRDGKRVCRFVPYIEAPYLRRLLDDVLLGAWDLTMTALPLRPDVEEPCAVKAALTIMLPNGDTLVREDIGQGEDWKAAATDAFKRAATRFGVANDLYELPQVWVELDERGNPLESPISALARTVNQRALPPEERYVTPAHNPPPPRVTEALDLKPYTPDEPQQGSDADTPDCPTCGGPMWDNRMSKKNPRAPDFKCKDRGCDGLIWPEKKPRAKKAVPKEPEEFVDIKNELDTDDLPF